MFETSKSMFETLSDRISLPEAMGVSGEDIYKQQEMESKGVKPIFEGIKVRIYTLSRDTPNEELKEYTDLISEIIQGVNNKTHALFRHERQFLADVKGWLVYLEWGTFTLSKPDFITIKTDNIDKKEEDGNKEESRVHIT